jgi:ankyrin repeat protein
MQPADPLNLIKSAFHQNDAASLRQLLDRHAEFKAQINQPLFPFDSPAIIHAKGREMLDVLLDAGADINAKSNWWAGGFGILHGADPDLAAYAIQRGAVVDVHAAARLGMLDRLRELIVADPTLVHARGGDGQTPLHFAGTIEIAQYLIEQGADLDARDADHESTPAQYMLRDRQAVAKYLVARGAATDILMAAALGDIDRVRHHLDTHPECIRMSVCETYFPMRDPRAGGKIYIWTLGANKTPHQVARQFGHPDILALLMERSPDELKLAQAYQNGDEETVKAILRAHPNLIRTPTPDDQRKLVDAAQDNNTRAVALMLSSGWPPNSRGQHGGTALHWAAWHGNAEMTREILRYNPPLEDAANDFHATPLGWATHGSEHGWRRKTGDYPPTVELLCAAGATIPAELAGTDEVKAILQRFMP